MSVIRVNPVSVSQYGQAAQESFQRIRSELERLVDDVVNVRYQGENAVQFKTQCGQLAADFATGTSRDLAAIAEAVRVSTTNIASSLGGQSINIQVNGSPVAVPPVPSSDGTVDVETSGLENLVGVVQQHFSVVNEQFDAHLHHLQRTDWEGNAKEQAVQSVTSFTGSAKAKAQEAERSITTFIRDQVQAVVGADR